MPKLKPDHSDRGLMHQLKVLRCNICHTPFLFESSLEDHKRDHAPKESDYVLVKVKSEAEPESDKRSRAKRKYKRS
jgi:hypothetical protein